MPYKVLPPLIGGGIDSDLLGQITATADSVKYGTRFMTSNGTISTGTLSLTGNATTSDVVSGKTFYSNSFTRQTGYLDTRTFIACGRVWSTGSFTPSICYNPDYVTMTTNQNTLRYTYTFNKSCKIYLNSRLYTDRGSSGTYWRCTIKKNADTLYSVGPYHSGQTSYDYNTTLQMYVGDTIVIDRNADSEGSTIDMVMYTTV